uniref:3-oxo-5-alpha-steroid 4-dehydrogenase C-terminal domain-containing protein n=1 Tax=Salix viminalis TaxID=40686 RepID=A0A6N2LN94_SALVM
MCCWSTLSQKLCKRNKRRRISSNPSSRSSSFSTRTGRSRAHLQWQSRFDSGALKYVALLGKQKSVAFFAVMSVVSLVAIAGLGISEILGKHLQYSKFWNLSSAKSSREQIKLSSRTGMLVFYVPALLSGVASFVLYPNHDPRLFLVKAALTIHFFKRTIEVLFVHRYSTSGVVLDSAILISCSYFSATSSMIYGQYLTQGFPEPKVDLKYPGVLLFLVGIIGNLYHHLVLASLRTKSDKEYKIPRDGLFGLVICPHYLFEVLGFIGIFFISQTLYPLCFTLGTIVYLMGRSYATRRWYISKFEDFPKDVKALVPYILRS